MKRFVKGTEYPKKTYVGCAMFTATFNLVTCACHTTVIFGIMKDRSLLIHTVASLIVLTHRNRFQNGTNDMSKMVNIW